MWLAAQTSWDPSPRSVMGGLLFLLGSLTLVGTWFGRPRLLMIGVLMTVTLTATSLAGLRFEGPFGEEVVTMNTPAAFATTQSMEIGALTLDLTNIPTEGALQVLSGEVAIGELKVIVPTDVELTIDAEVRIGAVAVFGVEKLSGLSQSGTIQIPAERPPVRKVKARLRTNIGAITVVRPVTESLLLDAPESSRPRPTTIGR